jgi:ribose/xylose/arabinose/galactoside ABC-type transport system permease subunit
MASAALRPAAGHGMAAFLRRLAGGQEMILFLCIILLFVVVGLINPRFVAERNLQSIFLGNAYIAVAAIGMSMVIISGNIDISVGSLIGVLATVSGTLAVNGYPIIVTWLVPLVVGAMVTALMGVLVAYCRIPSIVVSLGMLSILKGGLISVTGGAWISNLPEGYGLSQMRPLGVPMPIYFMVVLTALAAFWMRYSATGRAIYAVGDHVEAARLSGISARRTVITVFVIHGVFVGIASVLFATQLSVIQSTVPPNLELTIITASVVGGVSILGGTGTVIGSTLAAILLAAIGSSLIFVNLSPYWLRAVQGVMILLTVLADLWRRRRQALKWR